MKQLLVLTLGLMLCGSMAVAQKGAPAANHKMAKVSGGSVEDTITKIEEEGMAATKSGDPSWAEKYLADDYQAVSGATGASDKQKTIEGMKSGKVKFDTLDVSDRKVTMYAPNVAVSRSSANVKGTADGNPFEGTFLGTRVWVKKNGKWQAVAFTSTKKM
jgi:hypothetical protein